MADVFISYARTERAKAERIKGLLEGVGLSVFFDVDSLDGGDVFPDILDREVKSAGAVLGLWSPHALSRPWVKIECLIGKDRGVLVPASLEPINALIDLPAAFYGIQHIDLSDFQGNISDPNWASLLRSLARTLNRPEIVSLDNIQPDGDRASEADLRAQMESMREELNALRNTVTEDTLEQKPVEPRAAPDRHDSTSPEHFPAALKNGHNTASAVLAPIFIYCGAIVSFVRADLTDSLAWDLSVGAPLIALIASKIGGKGLRYGLALLFAASTVQWYVTDTITLGGSDAGLSLMASLICIFSWRPLVVQASSWTVKLAVFSATIITGTVSVYLDADTLYLPLVGASYMALFVCALSIGARDLISLMITIGAAFILIWIASLMGFAFDGFDTYFGDVWFAIEPEVLRLTVSSWFSVALASLAVWTLVQDNSKGERPFAFALCVACFVWPILGPMGSNGIDSLLATLDPKAFAQQAATPDQQSVIVVTGRLNTAFELNVVATLGAALLWGRLTADRRWVSFGVPILMGVIGTIYWLGFDPRSGFYPETIMVILPAVWLGHRGYLGSPASSTNI
ncbi:MAG: toll/interleukin-1 receptor domain-containing protein [Pseudomonadota bacterium]